MNKVLINIKPLASGKIKVEVTVYLHKRSTWKIATSPFHILKGNISSAHRAWKSKSSIIFKDYFHLPNNTNDINIIKRWVKVHELTNFEYEIISKYKEYKFIYMEEINE